jgi:AcrR family transcriptional regulator
MPRPLAPDVMASTAGEPDAVRDHILDAVYRVISGHGLAAASTRAIAEEAGIGAGTLYNYFEDRRQLVAAAMLRRAGVLSRPLSTLPSQAGTGTVADNLRRFAEEIGDILDQLVPLFAAAFSDARLLHALHRTIASQAWSAAGPFSLHPIEGYLVAEQDLGRIAADADCRSAALLILSLCHERAFLGHFAGKAATRKSITREIDFIARAISPATAGESQKSRTAGASRRKER